MAQKKKALGRGLKSLIPVDKDNEAIPKGKGTAAGSDSPLQDLPLGEIDSNPQNPRKRFNEDQLKELADTLKRIGLIQPITVQKVKSGRYQIIAGERRFRAAGLAGFKTIPAYIKKITKKENAIMSLVENIQRENLDVIEEAEHYQMLKKEFGMKQSEIAEVVGKNRSTVNNKLRLLNFNDSIKGFLSDRKLTEGQVRPLLSIQNSDLQQSLAEKIHKEAWSARRVEDEVGRLMEPGTVKKSAKAKRKDPTIRKSEETLRGILGTKVSISHNDKTGRGKITIDYFATDDLERILDIMSK